MLHLAHHLYSLLQLADDVSGRTAVSAVEHYNYYAMQGLAKSADLGMGNATDCQHI